MTGKLGRAQCARSVDQCNTLACGATRSPVQTSQHNPAGLELETGKQALEEAFGRSRVPPALHEDVEHDAVLVHRAPEVVQRAVNLQVHLIHVPCVGAGLGLRRRILRPKRGPNLRHHCRMLSCVTPVPRSIRISSTSRRPKLKT
jgi:hypothetical protein